MFANIGKNIHNFKIYVYLFWFVNDVIQLKFINIEMHILFLLTDVKIFILSTNGILNSYFIDRWQMTLKSINV